MRSPIEIRLAFGGRADNETKLLRALGDASALLSNGSLIKMTIARLIAKEVAEEWAITEFSDPTELTPAVIASIRHTLEARPFGNEITAEPTPGTRSNASRTCRAQFWHVIPLTSSSARAGDSALFVASDPHQMTAS